MDYPNFYENLREATARLQGTIVMYDGSPYSVLHLAEHSDGIFRVYMLDVAKDPRHMNYPEEFFRANGNTQLMAQFYDRWMEGAGKTVGIVRKKINSPHFNKFRPFPLGMCNIEGQAYYVERAPIRRGLQGLSPNGMTISSLALVNDPNNRVGGRGGFQLYSPGFKDCVMGAYPSAKECVQNLQDPNILNSSVGFHRKFAFVRGPLDMIFLAYKEESIGYVDPREMVVTLGRRFVQHREVIDGLGVFNKVINQ